MSDYKELYRKNKETGQWERLGSPIDSYVFSGDPKNDTQVEVTNPRYAESGETVKLYEALDVIAQRLDKHDGNISYLAEHGGGGGGGGGGSTSYAIEVTNLAINDGTYYASSSSLTVNFRITGGTSTTVYQYRVAYDGVYINGSSYQSIKNKSVASITIPDINVYTSTAPHKFMIEAQDPYGFDIESYSFLIYETSISIKADSKNILNISDNGNITIKITNKILNAPTTLVIENTTLPSWPIYTTPSYVNKTTSEYGYSLNLIGTAIPTTGITTGKDYTLKMYAQTTVTQGTVTTTITSSTIYSTVSFVGGNRVTAVFSNINTKDEYEALKEAGEEVTTFATKEPLLFSYSLFYGNSSNKKTPIYYAVRLDNTTNEAFHEAYPYGKLIMGRYFDENLYEEGYTKSTDNDYVTNGTEVSVSWSIPSGEMYEETSGWTVTVRGWIDSITGYDSVAETDFTKGNSKKFSTQIPSRNGIESNTLFAQWGCDNIPTSSTSAKKWESSTDKYTYITTGYTELPKLTMDVYNTNGRVSGFIDDSDSVKCMRLQSSAYAKVDFSSKTYNYDYVREVDSYTSFGNGGFSISITFKSDIHPFNDRTVFFLGENDKNGDLSYGIKVELEDVYWIIIDNDKKYTLHKKIQQGVKNTIDFNLSPDSDGTTAKAKILINGVVNACEEITNYDKNLVSGTSMYIGCDYVSGKTCNYADINVYDVKMFSMSLNDLQLSTNSEITKIGNVTWTTEVEEAYNQWKAKNFIYTNSQDEDTPYSHLFGNGEYTSPDYATLKSSNPPLPIMFLSMDDGNGFTKDFFYKTYDSTTITSTTFNNVTFTYYDPTYSKEVTTTIAVSLQGTSTITYKDKNLEIYFNKIIDEATNKTEMFQPKPSWLPEARFTLKADVVDSAHANNTSIGKWINDTTSGAGKFMEENPAMKAYAENIPEDVYTSGGTTVTGETSFSETRIRHTLEGFPIILIIKFAGEVLPTMLGIYSFNMGRGSYYNMGFKFLKSFTRRMESTNYEDKGCPALIDEYVVNSDNIKYNGGSSVIDQSKIYSFELNSDGDDNTTIHPTWSQDDLSILKHIGEFKYPSDSTDAMWNSLKALFTTTANFLQKSPYKWNGSTYEKTGGNNYSFDKNIDPENLDKQLSIQNALCYFDIAQGLGMIDSLGKNLTLRTWDGIKWFTAFYDMDSSLDLTNAAAEDVDSTVYIDTFKNKAHYTYTDPTTKEVCTTDDFSTIPIDSETGSRVSYVESWDTSEGPNYLIQYKNLRPDEGRGFGAYNSGLWNILRDEATFRTYDQRSTKVYYEDIWANIRNDVLPSENSFISIIEGLVGNCGEMLYNFDYNEKYISTYSSSQVTTKGNISMLHGTRIETIRNWLKDRLIFLDGIFAVSNGSTSLPYYESGTFYYEGGDENGNEFYYNVSSPVILTTNTGQGTTTYRYILEPYTDNRIIMPYIGQTGSKATAINATSIITAIDGFRGARFEQFGDNINLPSMAELNIKGTSTLVTDKPVKFETVFINESGESVMRSVNIQGATAKGDSVDFPVILSAYTKISYVDISDSSATSLQLSDSPLLYLDVHNSNINAITVKDQPNITTINFSGCKKLNTITIGACDKLSTLNLDNMENITGITIYGCPNLTEISCKNSSSLKVFDVSNMANLNTINLSNCTNENLSVKLSDITGLQTLNLSYTQITSVTINDSSNLSSVTYLSVVGAEQFLGFIYDGAEDMEVYTGRTGESSYVMDLSPFKSLESDGFICNANSGFACLRTPDNGLILEEEYFEDNTYLKRIFGTITIAGDNVFRGCSEFSLSDSDSEEEKYTTHVLIDATDISSCFASTSCNINDVMNVLAQCDNVKIMESLFSSCVNIITTDDEPISADIFKHCGKVTNMSNIFSGCLNMGGTLPDGMLKYLTSLTLFSAVFPNTISINDTFFGTESDELAIKEINSFNPKSNDSVGYHLSTKNLFKALKNLETITDSFNGSSIYFEPETTSDGDVYCGLFYNTPKLTSVHNSFNDLIFSVGYVYNLFGGDDWSYQDENHFPNALVRFTRSFNLESSTRIDGSWPDYAQVNIRIDKNMFRKVKDTLKLYGLYGNVDFNQTAYSCFEHFNKYMYMDKSENPTGFPLNGILDGCSLLENCSTLLYGLIRSDYKFGNEILDNDISKFSNEGNIYVTVHEVSDSDNVWEIPSQGMLNDCIKLTDALYAFADMNGFRYSLRGFELSNTVLKNVSYIFKDVNSIREGMIPYGMFNVNGEITNISYALSNSKSRKLLCYNSDWAVLDGYDEVDADGKLVKVNEYLLSGDGTEDSPYIWNKWVSDGINTKISAYKETIVKNGVKNLSDFPSDFFVDSVAPETAVIDKFIGDEMKLLSGDIAGKFRERRYFCPPDIFKYCKNDIDTNINGMFHGCGTYTTEQGNIYIKGVYGTVCPYIFESVNTVRSLNAVFSSCMFLLPTKWDVEPEYYSNNTHMKYDGERLPISLFSGMTNVTDISSLFAEMVFWGGTRMDKNAFADMTLLENASGLFRECDFIRITGTTECTTELEVNPQLPVGGTSMQLSLCKLSDNTIYIYNTNKDIFSGTSYVLKSSKEECTNTGDAYIDTDSHIEVYDSDSTSFTDIGALIKNSKEECTETNDTYINEYGHVMAYDKTKGTFSDVNGNSLFAKCPSLYDVSAMLSNASGEFLMATQFLVNNTSIINCTTFMRYCGSVLGNVPNLWDYKYCKSNEMKYSACYEEINTKVSNYSSIPDKFKTRS